jgi:GAF domain-containing protein
LPVQADDLSHDYASLRGSTAAKLGVIRTLLFVPMLKSDEVLGVIALYRQEVKPFADDDIELVRTFADQAVIAIENVRLFQALETRTTSLSQSPERQTATSEILRSISASPTDYDPVFDTILENATRLCGAPLGILYLLRDGQLQLVADAGSRPEFIERLRENPRSLDDLFALSSRTAKTQETIQIEDLIEEAQHVDDPSRLAGLELGRVRTAIGVPMLKGRETVGVIALYRQEVKPFADDEIELVRTFADQAAIAIENVHQFQAVQSRTADLTKSLERQTATSEILRAISQSPTDYPPVFDTILENATRLCDAPLGQLYLIRDGGVHLVAHRGSRPEYLEFSRNNVRPANRKSGNLGKALAERRAIQSGDPREESLYSDGDKWRVAAVELEGIRAGITVPLLKGGESVGAMVLYRREVRPFEAQQVSLVETFADQAVIAIENVRLFQALEGRTADLRKSLDRQTATSEILRSISQSPTDYTPVFQTILDNAVRLCGAPFGMLFLLRDGHLHVVADVGARPEFVAYLRGNPWPMDHPSAVLSQAARERMPKQNTDQMDETYRSGDPLRAAAVELGGIRTLLGVPMLKGDETVGIIALYRQEVNTFEDDDIELVTTFADQAVIAIENVRLFNETGEALERQTATADILKAISSSPTDVQPVFDAIASSAQKLCDATISCVFRFDGKQIQFVAHHGWTPEGLEIYRQAYPLTPAEDKLLSRVLLEGEVVNVADIVAQFRAPIGQAEHGHRSCLAVPILREGVAIGAIVVGRRTPGLFLDRQIELLKTFADQAVIAIENVSLFQALEGRTADLSKTLERQTATSEILRSISRSPTDYAPVFDTILDNATRLCEAPLGLLFLRRNDHLQNVASIGAQPAYIEFLATCPVPIDEQTAIGQAALQKKAAQVEDTREALLTDTSSPGRIASVELEGARTFLAVPMLRDEQVVGVIAIYRREVRRFDDSMVELLETFADQAVIAIENVRLFQTVESRSSELAQSVAELEALGDIAQAVSSSLDVDTVLDTIVTRAVQLSRADAGAINEFDEATDTLPFRAAPGMEHMLEQPAPRLGEGAVGRAAATRAPVQIADITVPGAYTGRLTDSLSDLRIRALLAVPMMQNNHVLGTLVVARRTPGEFPPEAERLLRALGTQSAIAIRNARLFREIEDKGRELEAANRHKSEFLANMSHELRTPLNAVIGFSEVLGERMFGELNDKQAEYVKDIHDSGRHLLSLINDILDLSKVEAGAMELDLGRFALAPALDNALTLVRERAERRGIILQAQLEEDLGEMEGDERKLKQILLNLLSNAIKFTSEGGRVTLEARQDGTHVHIAVRDTGVGISEEDLAVIFEEFKQVGTDYARKVEGTGLGLTLTKRFIEMHGGHITVTSEPDVGSVFSATLPLHPTEQET